MRYCAPHPGFTWIKVSDGAVPPNAVQGGREADGKPLYICRQWHKGGLHIGKTAPHLGGCYLAYGDATLLRWIEVKGRCTPRGWVPLEAGNEEDGTELWAVKVRHENSEQLGKTCPNWDHGCNYGYDSKEIVTSPDTSYFVLAHLDNSHKAQ